MKDSKTHSAIKLTRILVAAACLVPRGFSPEALADQVSTDAGNGADIEMVERNNPDAARIGSADLNTRWNASDRNEVVGLRFDLSSYTLSTLDNVSLNLINFRTNTSRTIDVYGVTQGVSGGAGNYDTETWTDTGGSAVRQWGDLPGLLVSDGTDTTLSIDTNNLTLLVDDFSITRFDESTVETIASAELTSFVRNYTGSRLITLLLTQGGSGSGGQFRFASREATELMTAGLFTGPAGTFAPYLEFDVLVPPTGDLLITNTTLTMDGLVLSGAGGSNNAPFAVLANPDVTAPSTNWPAISTNNFDASGNFMVTNPFSLATPQRFFRLLTLTPRPPADPGPMGFATVNGGITGGSGGTTGKVSTAGAFISAVEANGPRVVQVSGVIDLNGSGTGSVDINSDKTIVGLGTNAAVIGQLEVDNESNVIIRNLTISNHGGPGDLDGVRIVDGAHHVWVDHCTFVDCSDGSVDITGASDYVTVSWCKFMYVDQTEHRFVNLIAGSDTDAGDYRITFHNNWWSTGCDQRMPASRYGTVHLFNNYYFAPGND